MSKLTIDEQMRCVYAALQRLKYGRSTVDIAGELGVSRFMVGRMVQRARDEGLVEVRSVMADPIDAELSHVLADRYGLSAAYAVLAPVGGGRQIRSALASVCARLLVDAIEEDDIVGMTPGRTIIEMCERLESLPMCDVVQLTGVASTDEGEILRAITAMTSAVRGKIHSLHAPMLATDATAGRAIAAQPAVRRALARMDALDRAIVTIGGWPDASLLAAQADQLGEMERLVGRGIVAEIGTTLLDAQGTAVPALEGRTIGISEQQLRSTPQITAVGGGPGKERAVLAVARSGYADVLVTDAATARFLLDHS
ncbi:sugar-binding domain-containing protein [Zhihengliuella sp.]|uniref:sugar-binding transcriptional regulator n=1 Tax=Zhihengliuella sp. TaxID=1954483 RepID=UPI0028116FA0|nr:sugar-binding domain-containing protein [Zhihengliuella sp.]